MILGRHVAHGLAAYADGELDAARAARVAAHLAGCAACSAAWERYRLAAAAIRRLPRLAAPADLAVSIERALDARPARAGWWSGPGARALAAAAAIVVLVAGAALWRASTTPAAWDIVRVDTPIWRDARLVPGEWVETGDASTVRVRVGAIGTVDAAPNTRLQIVDVRPDVHRLALARGRISAEIVAPPRVFFVETPTSTVVDLGCAYTLEVDEDGSGVLQVTEGWAALEWVGRESLVPAGATGLTRPGVGPGTPAFDDASARLRQALVAFDFGPPGAAAAALEVVLAEARDRDTLTLWHLMVRVDAEDRPRVLERIVALTPWPAGLDHEAALALDPETLRRWREELAWTW